MSQSNRFAVTPERERERWRIDVGTSAQNRRRVCVRSSRDVLRRVFCIVCGCGAGVTVFRRVAHRATFIFTFSNGGQKKENLNTSVHVPVGWLSHMKVPVLRRTTADLEKKKKLPKYAVVQDLYWNWSRVRHSWLRWVDIEMHLLGKLYRCYWKLNLFSWCLCVMTW